MNKKPQVEDDELVERVARAMWAVTAPKKLSWAATPQTSKNALRAYARAALAAIRNRPEEPGQ